MIKESSCMLQYNIQVYNVHDKWIQDVINAGTTILLPLKFTYLMYYHSVDLKPLGLFYIDIIISSQRKLILYYIL